jgi:hypothetical protein
LADDALQRSAFGLARDTFSSDSGNLSSGSLAGPISDNRWNLQPDKQHQRYHQRYESQQ